MKTSATLSVVAGAAYAAAHGIVQNLDIDGSWYTGYLPYNDPYTTPTPERIVWAFPTAGNGPVTDVTSDDITCNVAATAAQISADVKAGGTVDFYWTTWPDSHKGPVMTYMANCNGKCESADAQSLEYFKIDEAGLVSGTMDSGTWATDELIANNNSWSVTIPSDIAAGNYLIRHEILALHSAGTAGGAQFYPMCANLVVSGDGTAAPTGVKFPGAYSETDPGITVNIYTDGTSYTIPGPAVYGSSDSSSGSSSGAVSATSAAATSAAATSAAAATTSAAAVESSTSVAIAATSSAVATSEAATSVAATSAMTSAAATSAAATSVSTTAVPTTLATSTKAAATSATSAATSAAAAATSAASSSGSSSGDSSVDINACLNKVNVCIANMQSKTGGAVDFSSCDSQRTACYAKFRL